LAASRTACFNLLYFHMHNQGLSVMLKASGVGSGGSGGSMNRGPELLGPLSYRVVGPQNNCRQTLRKIVKIVATR